MFIIRLKALFRCYKHEKIHITINTMSELEYAERNNQIYEPNPYNWKNKIVLVTGVNGFIGGNLSKRLLSMGAKVIGITNDDVKNKFLEYEKIAKKITNYKLDLKSYNSSNLLGLFHFSHCLLLKTDKQFISKIRSIYDI